MKKKDCETTKSYKSLYSVRLVVPMKTRVCYLDCINVKQDMIKENEYDGNTTNNQKREENS